MSEEKVCSDYVPATDNARFILSDDVAAAFKKLTADDLEQITNALNNQSESDLFATLHRLVTTKAYARCYSELDV